MQTTPTSPSRTVTVSWYNVQSVLFPFDNEQMSESKYAEHPFL